MGKCINQHATSYIVKAVGPDGTNFATLHPVGPLTPAMELFKNLCKNGFTNVSILGVRRFADGSWSY